MVTYTQLGINGRLGNQMFQIASTIGIALDNGMDYAFPEWKYDVYFQKPLPLLDPSIPLAPVSEFDFTYTPVVLPKDGRSFNIGGYLQSEKYWKNHKQHIVDTFEFDYLLLAEYKGLFKEKKYGKTCGIHVRRGDYLNYPHIHPLTNVLYWNRAQTYIESKDTIDTYIVFSDDFYWCKDNVKDFKTTGKRVIVANSSETTDLLCYSLCDHYITANSSFSWWGAYLGSHNTNKIVVAPKQWFGEMGPSADDIYCDSWIKI